MTNIPKKRASIGPTRIESVSQFVNYVMTWAREGERPVAFRGQSFHGWRTLPKIFRPDVGLYDFEKNAIRDLIVVHPQEFLNDFTMFDRLVRMQHFDLPTRLLDVTTNPLVALYFATDESYIDEKPVDGKVQALFLPKDRQRYYDSDRVSCISNLGNLTVDEKKEIAKAYELSREQFNKNRAVERLLWFVRIEKPHFLAHIEPSDLELPVYVKPKLSNRRIIAQSGAFIIYGARKLSSSEVDKDLRLQRIIVPAAKKNGIRAQLESLGIHSSALFPEIDKAAQFIVRKYGPRA